MMIVAFLVKLKYFNSIQEKSHVQSDNNPVESKRKPLWGIEIQTVYWN